MNKLRYIISANCDTDDAYNFNNSTKSRIGHLLKLLFPAAQRELKPDIVVSNPENPTVKNTVVGIFNTITWAGASTDPIEAEFKITFQNKAMVQEILCLFPDNNEIEAEWVIYEYDYQQKKYFKRFYTYQKPLQFKISPQTPITFNENEWQWRKENEPVDFSFHAFLYPKTTNPDQNLAYAFSANGTQFIQPIRDFKK